MILHRNKYNDQTFFIAPFLKILIIQIDDPSPVGNGPGPAPADSWEDKADMSSAATTPDDEDNSMEDDSGELSYLSFKCVFQVT